LVKYVLYGTANAETLTGSEFADTIYAKDGNDTINAGAGADAIWAGAGNDVITGGGGADTINLGAGSDTVKLTSLSDSVLASSDTISGFASGDDKIDISSILKGLANPYSAINDVPVGTTTSLFTLKNSTLAADGLSASVDVYYTGASTINNVALAEFEFMKTSAVKSWDVASGDSGLVFNFDSTSLKISGLDTTPEPTRTNALEGSILSNTKLATLYVDFATKQTEFAFAVTSAKMTGDSIADATIPDLEARDVPLTVVTGGKSLVLAGAYTVVEDATTLGTATDNQIRFLHDSVTGKVDIVFDTDARAGTTSVLSTPIHLEGLTGIDLTKTDFTFV